jgi:hypothetical protein
VETNHGLNVIEVDGKQFLLTATAGNAIHPTREAGTEENGQSAVPAHYLEDFERMYEAAAVREPKWAEETLCGRQWILMEGDRDGEEGVASMLRAVAAWHSWTRSSTLRSSMTDSRLSCGS